MAKTITLRYTPTPEDHVKGTQTFILHIARFRIILLAFALAFIVGVVLLIVSDTMITVGIILIGLFPILAIFLFAVSPMALRRRIRRDPRLRAERVWEMSDDEFWIKNKYAEVSFEWSGFSMLKETQEQYVFIASTFVFLPKRAFTSKKQEADFRAMAKRRMKKVEFIGE